MQLSVLRHINPMPALTSLERSCCFCGCGSNKLPAAVPADSGIILAHKTGSSGRLKGLKIAENDMGIFYLPDGSRLYLAVLVSDSALSDDDNCALIRNCGETVLSALQKTSGSVSL